MRSAWNWLLERAHGVRVTLFVVLIAAGTVAGWYLWKNGGYTENAPPTPQFMELYLLGSADSATASVVSDVVPVDSSGRACDIENAGCDFGREYVTLHITPASTGLGWMLVADTPPALYPREWTKTKAQGPKNTPVLGFPSHVWIHQGTVETRQPVTYQAQFRVHLVARPSDHLVVEMPALLNEANPQDWCGDEAAYQSAYQSQPAEIMPETVNGTFCSTAPGQPGFQPPALPFTGGPALYYAPGSVASNEVLLDTTGLRGFTLDSSDNAAPTAGGFDWTGSYQLEPAIYATNISASGSISRRQILLGVLIGVSLAALLGLIQEFRKEERRPAAPTTE